MYELKLFISDKSLTRLRPLNINVTNIYSATMQSITDENTKKNVLYFILNCTNYISHDNGETWIRKFIKNKCNTKIINYTKYGFILLDNKIGKYRHVLAFTHDYLNTFMIYDVYFIRIDVVLTPKFPIMVMFNHINIKVSLDSARNWYTLDTVPADDYNSLIGSIEVFYESENFLLKSFSPKVMKIQTILIENVKKCPDVNKIYYTDCEYGTTSLNQLQLEKHMKDVCYLNYNETVSIRNLTCQCISNDFICTDGYVKNGETGICERKNIVKTEKSICLDDKIKSVDIRGYIPLFNSEHYLKYCAADIFKQGNKNVSCRDVYQYVPTLLDKYGVKLTTSKKTYIFYIIIGVSIFVCLLILILTIYAILRLQGYKLF